MKLLTSVITSCFIFLAGPAFSEEHACEGSSQMTNVKQTAMPIPHAEGHLLLMNKDKGPVDSIGLFSGATAIDHAINQLNQGNGHGYGYYSLETSGGTAVSQWRGQVNTVMKDGQAVVAYKGTWVLVSGTGKYAGISGEGTYDGYFTSEKTRVIRWKGRCILASN